MGDITFTGQEAAYAQTALRRALGLSPERFPAQAFVGMISDEIEQLRLQGCDDSVIAALVSGATGKPLTGRMITEFYATPQDRGRSVDK